MVRRNIEPFSYVELKQRAFLTRRTVVESLLKLKQRAFFIWHAEAENRQNMVIWSREPCIYSEQNQKSLYNDLKQGAFRPKEGCSYWHGCSPNRDPSL